MIERESDLPPTSDQEFDFAITAVGYETRCTWVVNQYPPNAHTKIALTFQFLETGSFDSNRRFFEDADYSFVPGVGDGAVINLAKSFAGHLSSDVTSVAVFLDISSMSREMIANVLTALNNAFCNQRLVITMAYAPSKFVHASDAAPIRIARPMTRTLAGWSARPEKPLGAIFGLGCESGLTLGALQVLEPDNAWLFTPVGVDIRFEEALGPANEHIADIFDVTEFSYDITSGTIARAKYEALLNSIGDDFRIITVPFGPKIFAWLVLATVIFTKRDEVGVWTFSSYDQGRPIDREADGTIVWHTIEIAPRVYCPV